MSEENVEIVRGSYDAYLRGDLESALAAFDPEIEATTTTYRTPVSTGGWKDWLVGRPTGRAVGRAGVGIRRSSSRLVSASSRFSAFMPGDARVASMSNVSTAAVWTLRDGKCVRLDYYGSREQALEAAGLRE